MLDVYKVEEVKPEVEDEYYHSTGVRLVNTNFSHADATWEDVYSLTRFYFEHIFKDKAVYLYGGEVYVDGGKLKEGEVCRYDDVRLGLTIYEDSYPEENFKPLKKYGYSLDKSK